MEIRSKQVGRFLETHLGYNLRHFGGAFLAIPKTSVHCGRQTVQNQRLPSAPARSEKS
jgi:hypothetical protein